MTEPYPGGVSERRYLEDHLRHTLRKPQIASDTLLRALTVAAEADRAALVLTMLEQLADAALHLAAIYEALDDRSRPIARRLATTLPTMATWQAVAADAHQWSPEQILTRLRLPDDALAHATSLRGQPDLAWVSQVLDGVQRRTLTVVTSGTGRRVVAEVIVPAAAGGDTRRVGADEASAAEIADTAAELCEIAAGFLDAYLAGRTFPAPAGGC